MTEFKVQAHYYGGDRKKTFFGEKEPIGYHCFSIKNIDDLPGEYFVASSVLRQNIKNRNPFNPVIYCWLLISVDLAQKFNLNFEKEKKYQFVIKLGAKAAKFIDTKFEKGHECEEHQLVLKSKKYFENTVQKIGFWDSENYFYESKKKSQKPPRKQNNIPNQPENKNKWGKIALICLPILAIAFLSFLIIKWAGKRKKTIK